MWRGKCPDPGTLYSTASEIDEREFQSASVVVCPLIQGSCHTNPTTACPTCRVVCCQPSRRPIDVLPRRNHPRLGCGPNFRQLYVDGEKPAITNDINGPVGPITYRRQWAASFHVVNLGELLKVSRFQITDFEFQISDGLTAAEATSAGRVMRLKTVHPCNCVLNYLPPTTEEVNAIARDVCLSVC